MYNYYTNGVLAKNNSFAKFGLQGCLQRFANVLFCGRGFFFLCVGGKKQNKFPRTAPPYQRKTRLINPCLLLFQFLYLVLMYLRSVQHTCIEHNNKSH